MAGRSYTSITDPRYKFTAKERDSGITGLDYFGARYFDSRIGKWMNVDPLGGLHPDCTPYSYVSSNPIKNIDPDGKDIWDAIRGGVNAALSAISPSLATPPSRYYDGDRNDYRAG